jgi:HK97 family phage portal protein
MPAPWDGTALAIPSPTASGFRATSGETINETSSLGIIALFAGVRIIADAIATTPLRAVTVNPDGTRAPVIPSPKAITNPFVAFSLQEGLSQIVTSLILRGNAYMFITQRDPKTFKPSQLRVLHPDQVDVSWDKQGYRQYRIGGQTYPAEALVHLTGFMLPNALIGCGIIEYCRNALGIGIALEDVAGQFFQNGIMASGIIGVDAPLTDAQAKSAADMFTSRHAGRNRAFTPVVLGGGAKFQPISLTLEDAQFIQSRQFSEGQMATLLGIPPHLLGIVDRTTSWGTGIEVQGRAFVDYALRSYFVRIGNAFTSWLPDGMFADFITDEITRADTATRYANYQLALGGNNGVGWMNRNQVRALEGQPPIPGPEGEAYFVPLVYSASNAPAPANPSIPPTDPATGDSHASEN